MQVSNKAERNAFVDYQRQAGDTENLDDVYRRIKRPSGQLKRAVNMLKRLTEPTLGELRRPSPPVDVTLSDDALYASNYFLPEIWNNLLQKGLIKTETRTPSTSQFQPLTQPAQLKSALAPKKPRTRAAGPVIKRRVHFKARGQKAITKGSVKRLARRGGVKRISGDCVEAANKALRVFLTDVIQNAVVYADHGNRRTVTTQDVLLSLKQLNKIMYFTNY
jgi:histone H4